MYYLFNYLSAKTKAYVYLRPINFHQKGLKYLIQKKFTLQFVFLGTPMRSDFAVSHQVIDQLMKTHHEEFNVKRVNLFDPFVLPVAYGMFHSYPFRDIK